jgi:hypothetical protein
MRVSVEEGVWEDAVGCGSGRQGGAERAAEEDPERGLVAGLLVHLAEVAGLSPAFLESLESIHDVTRFVFCIRDV